MIRSLIVLLVLAILTSCQSEQGNTNSLTSVAETDQEAREDSLALKAAYDAQDKIRWSIIPTIETAAIHARSEEDAADDPAIWVHPEDRSKSLIYGSNKKGGLAVYDLSGTEVGYYPIGNINNVDLLYDFPIGDSLATILGCSNRSDQSVDLFVINHHDGQLQDIASGTLAMDTTLIDDIYGFCFSVDHKNNRFYCNINGKNGLFQQYQMHYNQHGIELELKRAIQFDSQTEGMVADNELGFLYVGVEEQGIWKLDIDPSGGDHKTHLKDSDNANPNIVYDIEGLSIYKNDASGYLVASSQGNFSYAVFDRRWDNPYLGSFKISASQEVDGVEETDGLDIVHDSLNADFPQGLLVVQDGFNYDGEKLQSQNFKLISFEKILKQLIKKKNKE